MNKKIIFIIILAIALIGSGFGVYYYLSSEDKNTSLTKIEKEWIENNKQNLIDLGVSNDIPVLNYVGEGLVFDYFTDLEKNTGLEFNRISYNISDNITTKYSFKGVKTISDNQIEVYADNYVLFSTENKHYQDLNEIKDLKIGVLETDLAEIKNYLNCSSCEIKGYKSIKDIVNNILGNESSNITASLNAMVVPQLLSLEHSLNEKLHNNYLINDLHLYYVINLGDNSKLNNIIKKYYKKWSSENFDQEFNKYFTSSYFEFSQTDQNSMASFKGKRYKYGYVENAPYDLNINGTLYGTNKAILDNFSTVADIEILYEEYSNIGDLLNGFNNGDVDIFYNTSSKSGYDLNGYIATDVYNDQIAIISNSKTTLDITSLKSLNDVRVGVLKDSYIGKLVGENTKNVVEYKTIKELVNSKESVIAIDFNTYNYYAKTTLKNYKIEYLKDNDNASYVMKSVANNSIFNEYLDFYLSSLSQNKEIGLGLNEINNHTNSKELIKKIILISGVALLFVGSIILTSQLNKANKPTISFKKSEKIKYMDMLTSLKNRNYLNDNIDTWDASKVYPQTIIIIDLNNIAYINDNYGHNAGDEEIKEAANVLIKNQVINSDIMRTNGNEFLIYLVGYKDRQIELYIKKLNKELKELSHGFGAAIGYSMITDDIKTIDDAINEATIDMRKIKEEANDRKDI